MIGRSKVLAAMLAALFLVVLLPAPPRASAGGVVSISAFSPNTVLVGGSATLNVQFYDDNGTSSLQVQVGPSNNFVFTAASVAPTCATGTQGIGTGTATLSDTACDANGVPQLYIWTLTVICTAANGVSGLPAATPFAVSAPGGGTILPTSMSAPTLVCLTTPVSGGSASASTISITKVDQFGQPLPAVFSIQQAPFWVEVAEVSLDSNSGQNPCDTAGGGGSLCSSPGVVAPQIFPNGLPNGSYRVVEIANPAAAPGDHFPNAYCQLVQVYRGPGTGGTSSGGLSVNLPMPITLTLPDANPVDLQLTFVDSCFTPGPASSTKSGISYFVGGTQLGITNINSLVIYPPPGSASSARVDLYVHDANDIPLPGAHVTLLIDKGVLALRRDVSSFPNAGGYNVIAGFDTCAQASNGFLTQSTSSGEFTWPYMPSSPRQQDAYTNVGGALSACVYVDPVLAPGTTPGMMNVQAIVQTNSAGGLMATTLAVPNYLAAADFVMTIQIPVIGPPANITMSASPTTLTCGNDSQVVATVKDAVGQREPDHLRVEFVTNYGGVVGGTASTLGPINTVGGQTYPLSSASAETLSGDAHVDLLTSTSNVGSYEVVVAAGGSVSSSNGAAAPIYNLDPTQPFSTQPPNAYAIPTYSQGLLKYYPSSAPVVSQTTVTCSGPAAVSGATEGPSDTSGGSNGAGSG